MNHLWRYLVILCFLSFPVFLAMSWVSSKWMLPENSDFPYFELGSGTTTTTTTACTEGCPLGWFGGGTSSWQRGKGAKYGTGSSSFWAPIGITVVDNTGSSTVYVADTGNYRLSRWTFNYTPTYSVVPNNWLSGTTGWQHILRLNASSYLGLSYPTNLFYVSDLLFVADSNNNRIDKWSSEVGSTAYGWIGCGTSGWQLYSSRLRGTGSSGFNSPHGVAIDGSSNIYIADTANSRISKWNAAGSPVGWLGSGTGGWHTSIITARAGFGTSSFNQPWDICLDSSDNIYVADYGNHRIDKWNASGTSQGYIGCGTSGWQTASSKHAYGTGSSSFYNPTAIYVDSGGSIYVTDKNNNRVSKWNSTGIPLGWLGNGTSSWQTGKGASVGTGSSSFNRPCGIFIDGTNAYIYVTDTGNHRVSVWLDSL